MGRENTLEGLDQKTAKFTALKSKCYLIKLLSKLDVRVHVYKHAAQGHAIKIPCLFKRGCSQGLENHSYWQLWGHKDVTGSTPEISEHMGQYWASQGGLKGRSDVSRRPSAAVPQEQD